MSNEGEHLMWNQQQYPLLESSGMGSEEIPKCCRNVARNRSIRFDMAMNELFRVSGRVRNDASSVG